MSPLLRRKAPVGLLTILAACLAGAALAWACTPQADIGLSPSTGGPGGSNISVSGSGFSPGVPVEVHWNSAAGPVLASATTTPQGTFAASVRTPAAAPDTYTVVATSPQGIATASFTVVGAPANSPATPGAGTAPGASAGSNPSSGTASGGSEASGGGSSAGSNSVTANGGARTGSGAPTGVQRDGGGLLLTNQQQRGLAESASGTTVFSDSLGSGKSGKASASTPSARSAAADLWAGFGSPTSGILSNESASPATGGSMSTLTAALLGLGLATGLAGLGIAGARRRSRAGASSG